MKNSGKFARSRWRPYTNHEKDACGVGFIYQRNPGHGTLVDALEALRRLEHRGACAADGISGDGAGLMTEIPRKLLREDGFDIFEKDAVGVLFIPREASRLCKEIFEETLLSYGFTIKGWRQVPTRSEALGPIARLSCPSIQQVVLAPDADIDADETEMRLYAARQHISARVADLLELADFHIASLSCKTIVYKALTTSNGLRHFYKDLTDESFESRWAVFHRRFSTNTQSRWKLAQPFRFIAHNGEINTIEGNINWLKARLSARKDPTGEEELYRVVPDWAGSDSSVLDYALEMVLQQGDSPEAALMKLIPEAYENESYLEEHPEVLHFYEYFSSIQEPWDGPALIVYSDGKSLGATLDRNGLRPARYAVFEDGTIMLASEAGIPVSTTAKAIERSRLGPGEIISVDIDSGAVKRNMDVKKAVAAMQPYGQWLLQQRRVLSESAMAEELTMDPAQRSGLQSASGYGLEDLEKAIPSMVLTMKEPVLSMGDDTPLAVLSRRPRTVYDYFKQRFAQVTNPPIDPIRERVVMSLQSHLGIRPRHLAPDSVSAQTMLLPTPVLNESELAFLYTLDSPLKATKISTVFDRGRGLEAAIRALCERVRQEVKFGCTIVVLSDRQNELRNPAIPPMMAAGAVHHDLIEAGLRLSTSIVVETAQCWTSHHLACLLAVGAHAVCPYLALESVRVWAGSEKVRDLVEKAEELSAIENTGSETGPQAELEGYRGLTVAEALGRYKEALEHGLLKILSKMGVSKVSSYKGAQILECLGFGPEVMQLCFPGINSPLGGMDFADIEQEVFSLFERSQNSGGVLVDEGYLRSRQNGEYHRNNPTLVTELHKALGLKRGQASEEERKNQFEIYGKLLAEQPVSALRDLVELQSDREPVDIEEVEPLEAILAKFLTGGMSLGALSKEAHEALAIAMNRIGGRSNSGEGGEDSIRNKPIVVEEDGTSKDFPGLVNLKPGDSAASSIRQVASGRFGVTPEYLVNAEQLEIKIAQGAKPGEGGQLPGHKVSAYISKLRRTKSGVSLISPPPHHDIYSIEDLAQLIHDLKAVNPGVMVSVKLVSEGGIGTIATGVAKADADIIHISGHDGGTGAAPLSSIKNAGMPWELGLSETHATLVERGLRNRVKLRVDGGLRSGLDIIKASVMGANEFAFGTLALLAQGCIMARVCHTNNCPVGIATQKEKLRERFLGDPDTVVRLFNAIAEEVRFILASMGYRSLSELTGRVDLVKLKTEKVLAKTENLDLQNCFKPEGPASFCGILERPEEAKSLNEIILSSDEIKEAVHDHGSAFKSFAIKNTDRTVGASLSGAIAKEYGDNGFKGKIVLHFKGAAGQSFGAFNVRGVRLNLIGEANDYVGKGMCGGEIVIKTGENEESQAIESMSEERFGRDVLIGNTALYGATGGRLFVAGKAGERFAVRNSRALAVVEGAGDHLCEYMTGGTVVVLGSVGRNFGAGMTGGITYILDQDGAFLARYGTKPDLNLSLRRPEGASGIELHSIIEEHYRLTDSSIAEKLLRDWSSSLKSFILAVPESELKSASLKDSQPLQINKDNARDKLQVFGTTYGIG